MSRLPDLAPGLVPDGGGLERRAGGAAWAEGPLWLPGPARLRWSDIPNDRILEWDEATGASTVFRQGCEYTNGRTLDLDGQVVQCSHGRRALEREGPAGPEVLVELWSGGRFNSPNDVALASDGALWFTDPPYGLDPSGREGRPGPQDYPGCHVFRLDPVSRQAVPVVTDMVHPNGIGFAPDERVLYVSDTGFHGDRPEARYLLAYPLGGPGGRVGHGALGAAPTEVVGPGEVFARVPVGAADGFAVDLAGRVWTSAGDGVYVYAPDGSLLGHVPVPETVSNVCFGGSDGRQLFVTASTSLYRISTCTGASR